MLMGIPCWSEVRIQNPESQKIQNPEARIQNSEEEQKIKINN